MEICNSIAFLLQMYVKVNTKQYVGTYHRNTITLQRILQNLSGSSNCNFYHYILQGND